MTKQSSPQIVLALDSAGSGCSVAVGLDEKILAEKRNDAMYGQAETLLPLVDACMRDAGQVPSAIGLVATTVGPGSFTGIRVGLAAAHGVALATGARVIGVTSFEAVAAEAAPGGCSDRRVLLIALESRREDLYIQFFDRRGSPLSEPAAIMPALLHDAVQATAGRMPLLIAGDAEQRAAAALARHPHTILGCSASGAAGALRAALRLLRIGKTAGAARPYYLRPADAALPRSAGEPSPAAT